MGPKLSNVVDFYIHGVRDGHLSAALDKYVADRFVEHSPGIGDGREGLAKAFEPLLDRHYRRNVHPMRGFEDGSKVFLHTFSTYGWREIEHVTLDIFDTDADDHIVEHWGVTTPLAARARAGNSQIDGPRWVTDTEPTGANKSLVNRYVRRSLIGGADPAAYVSTCIEHDPDPPVRYVELLQLVGAGNFVATACRFLDPAGRSRAAGDLYRVEAGRIVEHWGAREGIDSSTQG